MSKPTSVAQFIAAIQQLPSDDPDPNSGVWYRTQKQHWLGWLEDYDGPGAYGRRPGQNRDARYAYNHIANPQMLDWIIEAAQVDPGVVRMARGAAKRAGSMHGQSKAIRQHVP